MFIPKYFILSTLLCRQLDAERARAIQQKKKDAVSGSCLLE